MKEALELMRTRPTLKEKFKVQWEVLNAFDEIRSAFAS